MTQELINEKPVIHEIKVGLELENNWNDDEIDAFQPLEIFELIRNINDPEHPLSLEQLNVVDLNLISIQNENIQIFFTPTIPHCSMATLIGLCIRVQLLRTLPARYKVDIMVSPGSHQSESQVNKQLNDKERVAAALENNHLLSVCNNCLKTTVKDE